MHVSLARAAYLFILFRITAPGTYDVERVDKTILESSPAYSFGLKHKEQRPDDIPGTYFF